MAEFENVSNQFPKTAAQQLPDGFVADDKRPILRGRNPQTGEQAVAAWNESAGKYMEVPGSRSRPPEMEKPGTGDEIMASLANGVTAGFAPKIAGAIAGATGGDSEYARKRYISFLDRAREDHPVASFVADTAGSMVLPGSGMLGLAAQGAARGAGEAISRDESTSDVAKGAALGGALGAAAHGVTAIAGKALSKAAEKHMPDVVRSLIGRGSDSAASADAARDVAEHADIIRKEAEASPSLKQALLDAEAGTPEVLQKARYAVHDEIKALGKNRGPHYAKAMEENPLTVGQVVDGMKAKMEAVPAGRKHERDAIKRAIREFVDVHGKPEAPAASEADSVPEFINPEHETQAGPVNPHSGELDTLGVPEPVGEGFGVEGMKPPGIGFADTEKAWATPRQNIPVGAGELPTEADLSAAFGALEKPGSGGATMPESPRAVAAALEEEHGAAPSFTDRAARDDIQPRVHLGKDGLPPYDPSKPVDPLALRGFVSNLKNPANQARNHGGINAASFQAAEAAHRAAKDVLDQWLDASVTKGGPSAKAAIKKLNQQIDARLAIQRALDSRIPDAKVAQVGEKPKGMLQAIMSPFRHRGPAFSAGGALVGAMMGSGHVGEGAAMAAGIGGAVVAKQVAERAAAKLITAARAGVLSAQLIQDALKSGVPRAVVQLAMQLSRGGR